MTEGDHGQALKILDGEIRIPFTNQLEPAIPMAQQLRAQPLVWPQTIQGEGGADQLLIGGGDPWKPAIEIGQELTAIVQDADAPGRIRTTHGGSDPALQCGTERPLGTTW